jgi:hypothetical protein
MRRIALILAVVAAVAAVPASASAALVTAIQKAGATVSPNKAGTKKKPQAVTLKLTSSFDPSAVQAQIDAGNQFAMTDGTIFFPKEGVTNAAKFPGCTPDTVLRNEKQCPKGSKIGTGKAVGVGLNLVENVTLTLFNRPKGAGVTVLVVSVPSAPVELRDVVNVDLTKLGAADTYGYKLKFTVPSTLLQPVQGVLASVQSLNITIPAQFVKKGKKKIPYIATTGCAAGSWTGEFTANYTTTIPVDPSQIDSSQTVKVSVPCRK